MASVTRPDMMPEGDTLAQFARAIGEEAALQLAVRFGGRRLYIPKEPPPESEIVQAIGADAAALLAKQFGGVHFEMPLERGKRERIVALSTQANAPSVGDIARVVGCTERHVYQVRSQYRKTGGFLPLASEERIDRTQLDIFAAGKPNHSEEE
jgi:hypothetical protein